jgi:hypothetical protein
MEKYKDIKKIKKEKRKKEQALGISAVTPHPHTASSPSYHPVSSHGQHL